MSSRREKRRKPVVDTPLISLADIAFLIIFFFMLSSSFMRDRLNVDVPFLPKLHQTDSANSVSLTADRVIHLNGDPLPDAPALTQRLGTLLAGKTKNEDLQVRFKCDRNLLQKDYQPVLEAIAAGGGVIAIMHEVPITK